MHAPEGQPLWMRHDRTPGSPDDDFLVPVEAAIGPVLSAATNRTRRGYAKASAQERGNRIALGIVGALVGGLFGAIALGALHDILTGWKPLLFLREYDGLFIATGGLGGLVLGVVSFVGLALLLRRPRASWVGKHGVQRYTRGLVFGPKLEVFRFDDAISLKVSRVRHFVNGGYTGTNFDYVWWGPNGKIAFRVQGRYNDTQPTAAHEDIQLAWAAEAAWSNHRIAHFDRMIAQQGMARFQCGRDWIGIGKGFLELGVGNQSERVTLSDLKDIHFDQGQLVLKKKDATEGFFRSQGVFRFPVAALDDFQVFLVVLEEQTGVRFR